MTRLVVASHNAHKVRELSALLDDVHDRQGATLEVVGLEAYPGAPTIEETADTFHGNAELKAVGLATWLRQRGEGDLYVLADDSGLCVDALDGAPGVYSARFAGPDASDAENNMRLVRELEARQLQESRAHYVCALALVQTSEDAPVERFEGRWDVLVRPEARGTGGFGYDPHAWLEDGPQPRTVAELDPAQKAALSHRGRALRALLQWWNTH